MFLWNISVPRISTVIRRLRLDLATGINVPIVTIIVETGPQQDIYPIQRLAFVYAFFDG